MSGRVQWGRTAGAQGSFIRGACRPAASARGRTNANAPSATGSAAAAASTQG
eukprot:CAMPEP_0179108006 /NCGR_PEP_ID=MMETSP0796-20121207/50290_1 /TAXON_ID=73915 /ORGANISM="Pyrodinium bahamense, Strain pbaha01" /LENGTH=51 /DNA_ID=CAMNT_0020806069 /DNA_START=46 /DNA_END=198 /DNA_ORIENTATION=+